MKQLYAGDIIVTEGGALIIITEPGQVRGGGGEIFNDGFFLTTPAGGFQSVGFRTSLKADATVRVLGTVRDVLNILADAGWSFTPAEREKSEVEVLREQVAELRKQVYVQSNRDGLPNVTKNFSIGETR